MTKQEWNELGRRAVACKGWRWMPGMRAIEGALREDHYKVWQRAIDGLRGLNWYLYQGGCIEPVPDLRDPATRGCVLALVREAWEDDSELWGGRVEVHQDHRTVFTAVIAYHEGVSLAHRALARSGRNEAAALVAALEAAPKSGEAR